MTFEMNYQRDIQNLPELREFWKSLLPLFGPRCLLLLSGDVGAGKTTSVQLIADLLEMHGVQSPSFAIHLRYENKHGHVMDHVDLYRIEDDEDLESSGFWDLFSQNKSLIVIEWANRLNPNFLPLDWQKIKVDFKRTGLDSRQLTIQCL